ASITSASVHRQLRGPLAQLHPVFIAFQGYSDRLLRLGGAVKAFSPDLKLLAEGIHISEEGDTALNLWLVNSGKLLGTLPTAFGKETGLHAVVFSRDGKMLAAIDAKKMVHLWEIATRKKVHQCQCSHDPVTLTFTPSGRLLTLESEAAPGQLPLVVDLWDI